jgi:hypothetical protein
MTDTTRADRQTARTRVVLSVILVLLFLLLAGLGFFIVKVVQPAGLPQGASSTPAGLEWIRSIYGYGTLFAQQFFRPINAAVGPDGAIYGTDPQRGRVLVFNPDGSFRSVIELKKLYKSANNIYRPLSLGLDPAGNLYVGDYSTQSVVQISPQGTLVRQWPVPGPTGITVSGGRIYVTTNYGVAVFSLDGKLLTTWGKRGRGPEEFDNPHGTAIGSDGTVYVTDTLNSRIKAYKPDGTLLWIWPEDRATAQKPGVKPGASTGPLQVPTGAVLDGQGRLVFVDPFNFDIIVLQVSAKGAKLLARYGDYGQRDGFFFYPSDIGYDAARDWFVVADTENNRLQVVRIPGSAGNALMAGIRRTFTGPQWLCAVPLILLLVAIALLVLRRRAKRDPHAIEDGHLIADEDGDGSPDAGGFESDAGELAEE